MKKTVLVALVLTLINVFFLFMPVYYFVKSSANYEIRSAIGYVENKTKHTIDVYNQHGTGVDVFDLGYVESEMYFIKGFENIDSLKSIIRNGTFSFIMDKVNDVFNEKLGWSGSEIIENKDRYLFSYASDRESEIVVISIINLKSLTANFERRKMILFVISAFSLIMIFTVNLHFIKRLRKR